MALGLIFLFGIGSCTEGQGTLALYHSVSFDFSDLPVGDRAAAEEIFSRILAGYDSGRKLILPLAIASIVVGLPMASLAMRALLRRAGSHALLMQLVVVHSIIFGVTFAATVKPRRAQLELQELRTLAGAPTDQDRVEMKTQLALAQRIFPKLEWLYGGVHTLASLGILVALTRKRSILALQPALPEA